MIAGFSLSQIAGLVLFMGNFINLDSHLYAPTEGTEKAIVHYFFAENELKDIFAGFDIIELMEDKKDEHYCILIQK